MFAAPWQSIDVDGSSSAGDDTWWTFPGDVADGDTVITVVQGREPAILGVSVLHMRDDDDWSLEPAEPRLSAPLAATAISRRSGVTVTVDPRSMHRTEGAAVLAAIDAESDSPTPWFALATPCADPDSTGVRYVDSRWGCTGCGREWEHEVAPRFQLHVATDGPFSEEGPVAMCPNCHDIVHQPLGHTVDELMFAHRPPCPRCGEHRTFHLLMGMPMGPPPYGTIAGGCVIIGDDPDHRCGACGHEW